MLHVPSMEGLGRCALMTMSMPLFCVDDEHNATGSLEETHSIAGHGDAFVFRTLERTRSSPTFNWLAARRSTAARSALHAPK
jgi:hypothetical protein